MQELTASIGSLAFGADGFEQFEDGVFARICEAGRRCAEAALLVLDDELAGAAPAGWKVKDRRARGVVTRFGEVRIYRRRFVDSEGGTHALLDEHLGLEPRSRVSPSLERLLVTLSATVSFRIAADIVSTAVGTHVSHATAHALLGRAGSRLAAEGEAAARDLHDFGLAPGGSRPAPALYCEADGTVIALQNTRARRGEVKLAVFYTDKRDGVPVAHAGFQRASAFWREASAAAGGHFDLGSVRQAVVAGDGARWVRGGVDALPEARYQLDPFHVRRALLRASRSHTFSARVFCVLYGKGLAAADEMLSRFAEEEPERGADIEGVRSYLSSNADGLWRGGPGCGTIEGHIDKIVACRFKKRGRRWSPNGADRMAHVLAARRSGRSLPVGSWSAPAKADVRRPPTPGELDRAPKHSKSPAHQGHIVGNAVGTGLTRKLRDISGARKADY